MRKIKQIKLSEPFSSQTTELITSLLSGGLALGISDYTTGFQNGEKYKKVKCLFGIIPIGYEALPYSVLSGKTELISFIDDIPNENYALVRVNNENLPTFTEKFEALSDSEKEDILSNYYSDFWEEKVILEVTITGDLNIYYGENLSESELKEINAIKLDQ